MDSQEVSLFLEECLLTASTGLTVEPTEAARLNYRTCRESLSVELSSLLQEAVDMKWPFVPERWQYKQSVSSQDKANLTDLISQHLIHLLALLKAAIVAREARCAVAVVFLVDRYLYWMDDSSKLLKITKALHRHHPGTPIAPQLVIRQARLYLNLGKLQKAEYILSSLINNGGATGCWVYHLDSDRALVQAVSVQVRGLILQKLGLWLEAAELIWASLVGYYALPQPDKKGIGTSLGVLANILVSMSDTDFKGFTSTQDIDLSFLGESGHRLLCAAEAAKMGVVYSQYASLYVLTNVVTQGTCLLSYSFSAECPSSEKQSFLLQAKEAFEIGLLTKTEGDLITSKQELHTFLKAAYSLLVTHKWLGTSVEVVAQVREACREAVEKFYAYCHPDNQDKDTLCTEIMRLIACVKSRLRVEPFPNSDKGSFIPDSYRSTHEMAVKFTLDGFSQVMRRYQQYHASVCEATETGCRARGSDELQPGLCITSLGTTIETLNTEHVTKNHKPQEDPHSGGLHVEQTSKWSCPQSLFTGQELCSTLGTTDELPKNEGAVVSSSSLDGSLGCSWQNIPTKSTGTPLSSNGNKGRSVLNKDNPEYLCDPHCLTEVSEEGSDGVLEPIDKSRNRGRDGVRAGFSPQTRSTPPVRLTSTSHTGSGVSEFEMIDEQCLTEAVECEGPWPTGGGAVRHVDGVATQSVSSFSSLGDSFGSRSSWEKLSLSDPHSPVNTGHIRGTCSTVNDHGLLLPLSSAKSQPPNQSRVGTNGAISPADGAQSFSLIETPDGPISESAIKEACPAGPAIGGDALFHRQSVHNFSVDPEAETEADTDSLPIRPDHDRSPLPVQRFNPEQRLSTEIGSSFELVEKELECLNIDKESSHVEKQKPSHVNLSCYTCLNHGLVGSVVHDGRQYFLTQEDYNALLAGMCHGCLIRRLQSNGMKFQLVKYQSAYCALQLKYSRVTELWTARETYAYIGEPIGKEGRQRTAIWVQSLHQEERLSSYVAKEYLEPKEMQFHLNDVERQMTAQYYVTQFNKTLYNQKVTAQIFFIPSEVLLILEGDEIVGCVTVEPYMLGDFVKLTNNTNQVVKRLKATEYGIAFGHFTYLYSNCQEVVVDLQGWVTANGKGLMYLTDPQLHSLRIPKSATNFAERGLRYFLEEQHGPKCNDICKLLKLAPMKKLQQNPASQKQ